MTEVILETVLDIVKTVPILFVVYLIVGWMETRADSVVRLAAQSAHRCAGWRNSAVRILRRMLRAVLPRFFGTGGAHCGVPLDFG